MAARLHSHHQAMASAVEEKTRDLQEANRTLFPLKPKLHD
nr:nitrate/nitrite sensor protein NarQ [Candidatus Pantoea persica]